MKIKEQELQVGDFLVSSWGYDQTNIDFFKVISMTAKTAKVVKVQSKVVSERTQENGVVPTDEISTSQHLSGVHTIRECKYPKIGGYAYISLWDGNIQWETAPGYGH